MTRRLSLVIVFVLIAQLLLGCFKADMIFDVNEDDSSTLTLIIGIQKQVGNRSLLDDVRRDLLEDGAKVTPWEDGDYVGYRALYEFEDPAQLSKLSSDTTRLSIQREGDRLYATMLLEAEEPDIPVGIDATVSIIVPGRVISYSEPDIAEQVAENQVTWWPDMEITKTYELTVIAELESKATPSPVNAETITIQPPLMYRGHKYTVEYQTTGEYRRSDANLFFVATPEFFTQYQIVGLTVYRDGAPATDEEELRTIFTLYAAAYLLYERLPADALSSLPPDFGEDLKKATSSPSFVAQQLTAILKDRRSEIAQALRAMLTPQTEPARETNWLDYVKGGVEAGKGLPEAIDAALETGQWATSREVRQAAIQLRELTNNWRPLTLASGERLIDVGAQRLQWDSALSFLPIALQVIQAAELQEDRVQWLAIYQSAFQSGKAALDADQTQAAAQVQKESGDIVRQRLDILSQAVQDKALNLGAKITAKTLASKLTSWSINRYGLQHIAPYVFAKAAVLYGAALTIGDLLFGLSNVYDHLRLAEQAYELHQRFQAGRLALQGQAKAQRDKTTYDGELAERFRAAYMLEMLAAAQAHRSYADGARNAGIFGIIWAEAANEIWELATHDEQTAEAYVGHPLYVDTAVELTLRTATSNNQWPHPIAFSEDFDALEPGRLPSGWSTFGSEQVTPQIAPCSSSSTGNLCLYFPYAWHYSDKWLIKDDLDFQVVTTTVKLRFLRPVADKAGLVVGWAEEGDSYIQAMPNIYHRELEFKAQADGQLLKWESTSLAISAHTDYWLRIALSPQVDGRCQVQVWWSDNGADFVSLAQHTDLVCRPGRVGVVTEGPGMAEVVFDDFEAVGVAR